MDPTTKARITTNASNLIKRFSAWVTAATTAGATIFFAEPEPTRLAQLHSLPISPVWFPLAAGAMYVGAAIWPQFNLKAHADEASPAEERGGPTTIDFPLPTGPAPLPTVPPHEG